MIRFKNRHILLAASGVFALSSLPVLAQTETQPSSSVSILRTPIENGEELVPLDPKDYPQGMLFPYSLLDSAYTGAIDRSGNVNYLRLKDNKYLGWFLQAAAVADLTQFPAFDVYSTDAKTGRETKVSKDRSPELVFWINAYNAHLLNAVAQAYPLKTIDTIKDFDTAQTRAVAGKNYSFKELRAKIASFGDPRALFALPSGTAGGLLPSPTAIRWSEYDARMNSAVSVFVNDPRNVRLNRTSNLVILNSVFQEMDEFFKPKNSRKKGDGLRLLLSGYTDGRANRSYFTTNEYRIEYVTPSRNINDQTNDTSLVASEAPK